MSYNKALITGLLREKYQYDGVVCTDWGLVTDAETAASGVWPTRTWGAEYLGEIERMKKILDAGLKNRRIPRNPPFGGCLNP